MMAGCPCAAVCAGPGCRLLPSSVSGPCDFVRVCVVCWLRPVGWRVAERGGRRGRMERKGGMREGSVRLTRSTVCRSVCHVITDRRSGDGAGQDHQAAARRCLTSPSVVARTLCRIIRRGAVEGAGVSKNLVGEGTHAGRTSTGSGVCPVPAYTAGYDCALGVTWRV